MERLLTITVLALVGSSIVWNARLLWISGTRLGQRPQPVGRVGLSGHRSQWFPTAPDGLNFGFSRPPPYPHPPNVVWDSESSLALNFAQAGCESLTFSCAVTEMDPPAIGSNMQSG